MFDILIDTRFVCLILLSLLTLVWLVQLIFYWGFFWRLAHYRAPATKEPRSGVSVVICAHNEYYHLKENLPFVLDQDYPDYEVVVVNHASDDDTSFLLQRLEEQYPRLKTIAITEDLNFFSGKKFPLSIGIKSARYDHVLLTDADCKPASREWVSQMVSAFRPGVEVVLGYGSYNRYKGWLNKLIRFDTAHIAIQYLSYALAGFPYMGVGRNLSYLKPVFYRNRGFIAHYKIRSGDDDLFINRVANRSNTAIMIHPGSYTYSDPKVHFGKWITQKKRHLSTSHHYKFKHKILLGTYSLSLFLFYGLTVGLLIANISPLPVAGLFLIRLFIQYFVGSRAMKQLDERDLIPLFPVYEILLLVLNTSVLISNVFHQSGKWK